MKITIKQLIEEGQNVAAHSRTTIYGVEYCKSTEYERWLRKAIRYVEQQFPGENDTEEFRLIASNANGGSPDYFDTLIAMLEAFDSLPSKPTSVPISDLIVQIFRNFYLFDTDIKRRHANRPSIKIDDEYDLQDCLRSILKLFVKDIRPEEYVPSYAGANSRVDFFLPEHSIIIETKMTRSNLNDKTIGEQLTIDFQRYKSLQKCNHLICFVYDKESHITNPHGLVSDLEKLSDQDLKMTVIIAP